MEYVGDKKTMIGWRNVQSMK